MASPSASVASPSLIGQLDFTGSSSATSSGGNSSISGGATLGDFTFNGSTTATAISSLPRLAMIGAVALIALYLFKKHKAK